MRLNMYLHENCESPRKFARRSGVPLTTLQRALEGEWIGMRTAWKIVVATGGKVQFEHLLPEQAA